MVPPRRSSRVLAGAISAAALLLTQPSSLSAQVNHWWAGDRGHGISPDRVFRTDDATALTVPLAQEEFDFPQDGLWAHLLPAQATQGPRRLQHEGFYDAARRRVIFVGGSETDYRNDVLMLHVDLPYRWILLEASGPQPPGRRLHTVVHDELNDRLIMFGGFDGALRNDTWALSLSGEPTWSQIVAPGPPAPRGGHAAIFDPVGRRMIVFGGYDETGPRSNEVWSLDLDGPPVWTQLFPLGVAPAARSGGRLVYDGTRGRALLVCGYSTQFLSDVWALSLVGPPAWTAITPAGTPPAPREGHTVVLDPALDRLVLFGGYDDDLQYSDTWFLNLGGAPAWQSASLANPPVPRWGHFATYITDTGRMLVHGGWDGGYLSSTHMLRLDASPGWEPVVPTGPKAPPRHTFASAYDPAGNRMVVFGGSDYFEYQGDVWELSLAQLTPSWAPLAAVGAPPSPRRLAKAVFDPLRGRMLLFGGYDGTFYGDLWQLTLGAGAPVWTQLSIPGPAPTPRAAHSMIYDPVGDRVILFGGYDGVTPPFLRLNDLWALNLSGALAWQQLAPSGTPPSRRGSHAAAYDAIGHRMVVYGGSDPVFQPDVHVLSLAGVGTWTIVLPDPSPPPREEHMLVHDPTRDVFLMYGGYSSTFAPRSDIWKLSLAGTPSWVQLQPVGTVPGRWGLGALYQNDFDRLVVQGGYGAADVTDGLFMSLPTPVRPSLIDAVVRDGSVHLRWWAPGAQAVELERSVGGEWRTHGANHVDGSGIAAFEDAAVEPGVRYRYRCLVRSAFGEERSAEVAIEVGGAAPLAIERARITADGSVDVRFSAPGRGAARLSVWDVAGRRLGVADVTIDGPGMHEARVPSGAGAAGMYFVRLEQQERATLRKVVAWR
jgi:outer membrane protein assembly factor BamB